MPIAQVQATGITASAVASIAKTFVSNVNAGSLLICAVTVYDSTKGPIVTDSLNGGWTQAVSYSNTGVLNSVTRIFYCPNSKPGTCTVYTSWNGSANGELHLGEYSGAAAYSVLDQTGTGSASSGTTATTSSMSPSMPGELVWGWCGFLNSGSAGAGYTQANNAGSNSSEYLVQSPASAVQATWSTTGGYVCVAATFRPAFHHLALLGCGA